MVNMEYALERYMKETERAGWQARACLIPAYSVRGPGFREC